MTDFISMYYSGVLKSIRAEVDYINHMVKHKTLKGTGNEQVLTQLLNKFLPKRYSVGTGIVIDREGNFSKQVDIVIYDNTNFSSMFSFGGINVFPVDAVFAVIEVKTLLDKKSTNEAINNIASVKKLKYIKEVIPYFDSKEGKTKHFPTTAPLGFIFAYNSDTKYLKTFRDRFKEEETNNIDFFPAMSICLDTAIYHLNQPISPIPDPTGLITEMAVFPVMDENGVFLVSTEYRDFESIEINGDVHPVRILEDDSGVIIDQSRMLLLFLAQLEEWLAWKILLPSLLMKDYIPKTPQFQAVMRYQPK